MIKLKQNVTHTFTGKDIRDPVAPDITYCCKAYRPEGWTEKVIEYLESEATKIDLAFDLIGSLLLWIEQDGQKYNIGSREGAIALRDSVESQAAGYGDLFIRRLAVALYDQQVKMERERLGNYETPLMPSSDGMSQELSTSAA